MCECVSKKWETVPKRELNEDESMFFFGDEGIMGHLQLYLLNECYAHHCCQKDVIEGWGRAYVEGFFNALFFGVDGMSSVGNMQYEYALVCVGKIAQEIEDDPEYPEEVCGNVIGK